MIVMTFYLLELPVLSTLVVQDHYSASSNKTHPTFVLHKVRDSPEKFWAGQMDKLFMFKMSEVVKVIFSTQLLLTGPEVEKTHTYSEVRKGGREVGVSH